MTVLFDAGAFVAVERGSRTVAELLRRERAAGRVPLTHGGVVGQVWRGGAGRQAPLAMLLAAVEVAPLDDELGRRAGVLLGRAQARDVVDAALVCLARGDDDVVVTSDPDDIRRLASAAASAVAVVEV